MTTPLYIYKIWQDERPGPDVYHKAVVIAPDEAAAKRIHPANLEAIDADASGEFVRVDDMWASNVKHVHCQKLGTAEPGLELGVVCADWEEGEDE